LTIVDRQERVVTKGKALVVVLKEAEVVVPLAGMVDQRTEEQRLARESEEIKGRIAQLESRLRDNTFLSRAPSHIIDKDRQKLAALEDKLERLHRELSQLSSPPADN
jgi:valyl-tRNA synthetase